MEDDLIIDVEKLILTAQGTVNLHIELEVKMRAFVALFGQSGAGKTTLLKMLSGLIKPDKGFIQFGSQTWFNSLKKINLKPQVRNISLMFQEYALFPNMTVEENIQFAQQYKDIQQIEELLQAFGLAGFRKSKPETLSGGQKQRVALARALARKPAMLLLDEPLSSLDIQMRLSLQQEILKAHQISGATTIMISHDLDELFRLADHVICVENGCVRQVDKSDNLFLQCHQPKAIFRNIQ